MKRNTAKLARSDKKILKAVTENPEMELSDIGHKLVEQGDICSEKYIYQRLTNNNYLTQRIEDVRANHEQRVTRTLTPKVLDSLEEAMSGDAMPLKERMPFMQLITKLDKTFREAIPVVQVPVMVGQLQVYMNNVFKEPDAVDVTHSDIPQSGDVPQRDSDTE